jgi:hypothetical protein
MERIAVAAQRADSGFVVGQLAFELVESRGIFQHAKVAVCVARIVAGRKFNRMNIERLELGEHVFERQLRQQRCKHSEFHSDAFLPAVSAPNVGRG